MPKIVTVLIFISSYQCILLKSMESISENRPKYEILRSNCVEYRSYIFNTGDCIREGQTGLVYRGKMIQNNSVKIVRRVVLKKIDELAVNSEQYMPEIESLQRLTNQHCLQLIEFFQSRGHYYIITEFCDTSLEQLIASPLSQEDIFSNLYQISLGLQYIHSQNIVHRDINPSNIWLVNGQVKIAEFGKSILDCGELLKTNIGTFRYSSPQVLFNVASRNNQPQQISLQHLLPQKTKYSNKCDIWSLAVTLARMFGFQIFKNQMYNPRDFRKAIMQIQKHRERLLNHLKQNNLVCPQRLPIWSKIITKTFSFEQENRWSAKELRQYLQRHLKQVLEKIENPEAQPSLLQKLQQQKNQVPDSKIQALLQFESHIFSSIIELKQNIKHISCDMAFIWALIYLSAVQYETSFNSKIGLIKSKQAYTALERRYKQVAFYNGKKQSIQCQERLEELCKKLGGQQFNIHKLLSKVKENHTNLIYLRQQISKFLSKFSSKIASCPIASLYTILFAIVSKKEALVSQTSHELHAQVAKRYSKITGTIASLHEVLLDKKRRERNQENIERMKIWLSNKRVKIASIQDTP